MSLKNQKIITISLIFSFLFLLSPSLSLAAQIEKIPSPDQIKYFKVVKQEAGTLYGIRISYPVKEEKLEKIPSPDQIKYFRVVKQEAGTLYGIRIYEKENFKLIDNRLRMVQGQASWYRYKNGLFAASPDYPKGSVLEVTNLSNGKKVRVTVNDFGPERGVHPDRVIDLDYVAFSEIASPGAGLVFVSVEPVTIFGSNFNNATTNENTETNTSDNTKVNSSKPEIKALAAIVVRESDGEVIYSKSETKVLPIASLSKLIFAKVFLDLGINFDEVVTYKKQDENYNYEYCEVWESARLSVVEGETLTVGDLFYSAIIGSANNTVETLVRNSGLSRADFVARMNKYAKDLGATNTFFVEPTGLSPENVSSAKDYAIIVKEIFADKRLQEISSQTTYSFSTINTKKLHNLKNTNQLLKDSTYKITGSKTGYLHESGYCLVTRVNHLGENYIVINLNSKTRDDSFKDNEKLIQFSLKK